MSSLLGPFGRKRGRYDGHLGFDSQGPVAPSPRAKTDRLPSPSSGHFHARCCDPFFIKETLVALRSPRTFTFAGLVLCPLARRPCGHGCPTLAGSGSSPRSRAGGWLCSPPPASRSAPCVSSCQSSVSFVFRRHRALDSERSSPGTVSFQEL